MPYFSADTEPYATATADLQCSPKGIQDGEWGTMCFGETGETGI